MNFFKMVCLSLLMFVVCVQAGDNKSLVTLRDGSKANTEKVKAVWQALKKVEPRLYHELYKLCKKSIKTQSLVCDCRGCPGVSGIYINDFQIERLDSLNISQNGMIDEETRHIVVSSCCYSNRMVKITGGSEYNQKLHYPYSRWYEYENMSEAIVDVLTFPLCMIALSAKLLVDRYH